MWVDDLFVELDTTGRIIKDLESNLLSDVMRSTARVLNTNIALLDKEHSLNLQLLDIEGIDPLVKYNADVEGVKDLLDKLIEKYKDLAIKLNLAIRKTFLKLLGTVNTRTSTIENLLEELKSSPLKKDISLGMSKRVSVLTGETYKPYDIKPIMYVEDIVNVLEKNKKVNEQLDSVFASYSSFSKSRLASRVKDRLETLDDVKNRAKIRFTVRLDSSAYSVGVLKGNKFSKYKVPLKTAKRIKHGSGKDMETMLNNAKEANEDFKNTINDIFSIITDVESATYTLEEDESNGAISKQVKANSIAYFKFIKQAVPWLAFNSGMHVYNHIGYTIAIAKEFNKDK